MKIGLNGRYLQKRATGIENYLSSIMNQIKLLDTSNEYVLFMGNDKPVPEGYPSSNFSVDLPPFKTDSQLKRLAWQHFYLPNAIKKHKIDVFHEPSFITPLFKTCPTITTIYDMAFKFHPECFNARTKLYLNTMIKRTVNSSEAIIAISNSTKNDIIDCLGVNPDKIRVITCGVNAFFKKSDNYSGDLFSRNSITKDFVLNVSMISPRKNLKVLINAFKRLLDTGKIDCQLVLAGGKGWLYEDVFNTVRDLSIEKDVIFTGYVNDAELLALYNKASLFVYPSLYEGFGLPVLEAMACGCPVVSSNSSSLPEVCGDAALMIDPTNSEELADAIHKLYSDKTLRTIMIERGMKRVELFSWKNAAVDTINLYREINEYH